MGKPAQALYKPMYKSELLDILDIIRIDVEAISTSDKTSTTNVCKLLLLGIMDIVSGVFAAVKQRNILATGVLNRSLAEYVIDLTYLTLEDDRLLNERFINYAKLIKYWQRRWLATGKYVDELGTIEKEYREYVKSKAFADVRENVYKDKPYKLNGLSNTEKLKRLSKLWPRAQFDMVIADEIDTLDAVTRKTLIEPGHLSYLKVIDDRIKKRYAKHFSGLTTNDRVERIQNHKNRISRYFEQLLLEFRHSSNYTHPTPYAVSGYQLKPGGEACPVPEGDYHWFAAERNLFHYLDLAFLACSDILLRSSKVDIHKRFLELVDQTTYIKQFVRAMYRRGKACANSPRN